MFAHLYGKPPRIGVDMRADVPEELGARWHALIERALGGERFSVEEVFAVKGRTRRFLMSLNPIWEEGRVTGITVFGKDITEVLDAEEQARRHQAELAHVLRLHTVGQMAASLAHEINQPLGAIANFAQGSRRRLESGGLTAEDLTRTMDGIAREALRAGEITRWVRELIRKDEPRRQVADINEIVTAALAIVAPAARERGTQVRFRQGAYLPPVEVDRIQIEQVVLNLMLNALEAVEAGQGLREIEVRTSAVGDDGVEVGVRDTGIGLDAAMLERIFEPFHTSKPSGLGMGLAISRSIIDAHDGRLWAAANQDGGAAFTFELPAHR
jgi:two-component system sensor histidine kinase TtrS